MRYGALFTAVTAVVALGCAATVVAEQRDRGRAEARKWDPPRVTFVGPSAAPAGTGHRMLAFTALNPNKTPLPYVGYLPSSFDPPTAKGRISPLYRMEIRRNGKWQPHGIGWCGTGVGDVALPPGEPQRFDVPVPADGWDALKVGIVWYPAARDHRDSSTAWSEVIARGNLAAPRR